MDSQSVYAVRPRLWDPTVSRNQHRDDETVDLQNFGKNASGTRYRQAHAQQ